MSDTQSDATGPTDTTDATDGTDEDYTPPVADAEEPREVSVPALDERDDVVTDGGIPTDDPGDHRGQPWATTPGERGLEEGADVDGDAADAGLDVDMAPHSHESDEDDELAEPADAGTPSDSTEDSAPGRRVSGFDEVVDGGFGLGSAAPLADGAQPLGHAVKGTREGTTFVGPDDAGYDDVEPDVWFYSEDAARRAGFRRQGE